MTEPDQDAEPTMTAPEGLRPDGMTPDNVDETTPGGNGRPATDDQDADATNTAPDEERPASPSVGDRG